MKNTLALAGVIALIAASIFLFQRSTRQLRLSADFPEGTVWLCLACTNGFSKSLDEFNAWATEHPSTPLPCPKCKSPRTFRAQKCPLPDCGKYYTDRNLVIGEKVCCPVCKKPLP